MSVARSLKRRLVQHEVATFHCQKSRQASRRNKGLCCWSAFWKIDFVRRGDSFCRTARRCDWESDRINKSRRRGLLPTVPTRESEIPRWGYPGGAVGELWGTCKVTALGSSMGLQGERPMVESTGDPESGGMQESGGEQEVELLGINQGNATDNQGIAGEH